LIKHYSLSLSFPTYLYIVSLHALFPCGVTGLVTSSPHQKLISNLFLQARTASRPSTPTRSSRSASPVPSYSAPAAAPAASAGSAAGLEGLAAFIAKNYSGMGKSAMDVMPELRRKGITASGSKFNMGGQMLDGAGVASALRLTVSA